MGTPRTVKTVLKPAAFLTLRRPTTSACDLKLTSSCYQGKEQGIHANPYLSHAFKRQKCQCRSHFLVTGSRS